MPTWHWKCVGSSVVWSLGLLSRALTHHVIVWRRKKASSFKKDDVWIYSASLTEKQCQPGSLQPCHEYLPKARGLVSIVVRSSDRIYKLFVKEEFSMSVDCPFICDVPVSLKFFSRSLFPSASCAFPAVYHHSIRPATCQHQQLCSSHLLLVLELSEFSHHHCWPALLGHGAVCNSSLEAASQELPLCILLASRDEHVTASQVEARKRVLPPTPACALQNDCSNEVVYFRSTYKLDTITGYLRDRAATCLCCRFWLLLLCRPLPPFSNVGLDSCVENCCQQGWFFPIKFRRLSKYIPQILRDLHFQAGEHWPTPRGWSSWLFAVTVVTPL